ncbi:hypothetical protein M747DRAFT_313544 [Aspergillus niger ATCC 13496]|uniref:Uncharacterized protein n=3 Tax=Aspergillus niger TaxID=5061 RepID=A2QHF4_ASPNC|nr:hypothetical protein An03g06680 [Aspergillus niger]RDH22985.1 hypothetical protein M747DRAFT_313544 [Aspergillus niger ATCC 13496]CAK38424.1 hypothetical protein An03g06680 [Aspergillus niger]
MVGGSVWLDGRISSSSWKVRALSVKREMEMSESSWRSDRGRTKERNRGSIPGGRDRSSSCLLQSSVRVVPAVREPTLTLTGPACPVRMFIQTFKVEMIFMSAGWSNYTESLLIATLCSQDSGTHHVLDVDHAGRTEISPASYSKAELTSRLRRLPFPTCGRDTSNSKGSTYLQMPQCSSKFQSFTQLSYPTRKTPAEQEDAMLVATVGGTLEYCCGLQTDRHSMQELAVVDDCIKPSIARNHIELVLMGSGNTKIMSSDCCCCRCRQGADGNGGLVWYLLAMECPAGVTASTDSAFQYTPPSRRPHSTSLSQDYPRCYQNLIYPYSERIIGAIKYSESPYTRSKYISPPQNTVYEYP